MRFMTLIKSAEKVGPPPPELFQAIARLGDEARQAGVLVETAGLMPTAAGARVRLDGGQISTSEGPFGSGQEIVGGYAISVSGRSRTRSTGRSDSWNCTASTGAGGKARPKCAS
jgi:hypothetical protein